MIRKRLEEQELGAEEGLRAAVAGERGVADDDDDDDDGQGSSGGDDREASPVPSGGGRGRGEPAGAATGGESGGGQLVVREQATALVRMCMCVCVRVRSCMFFVCLLLVFSWTLSLAGFGALSIIPQAMVLHVGLIQAHPRILS